MNLMHDNTGRLIFLTGFIDSYIDSQADKINANRQGIPLSAKIINGQKLSI